MKDRNIIAETIFFLLVMVCGNTLSGTFPAVPENLKTSANEVILLEAQARGVQIYECRSSINNLQVFGWVLKAPEAELFDSAGKIVGRHYAGPTWEANDGSKVVGEVKAQDSNQDPTAIPWLLLKAKTTSGNGVFSRVTSIQRLHTVGGKAPAEECNPDIAGKEIRMPYEAKYYFYTTKP